MTPHEQALLPWSVLGRTHALDALPEALDRLRRSIGEGSAVSDVEDDEYGWKAVRVRTPRILVPRKAALIRALSIKVQINRDLIGDRTAERVVLDVLSAVAEAPRVDEPERPEEDAWHLESLRFAESLSMPVSEKFLHSSILCATPLGTGGLGVSMLSARDIATLPVRCTPGPVEITMSGPYPFEDGMSDEIEIFAFEHALNTRPIDTMQRIRLERRVAGHGDQP